MIINVKQTPLEIEQIISKKLKSSTFLNWSSDTFIGRINSKRCRFYFHKANIRNSFTKDISASFIDNDDTTSIRIRFISSILNIKVFISIHIWMMIIVFLSTMSNLADEHFIDTLVRIVSAGFIFDPFILFVGLVSSIIPISPTSKERLLSVFYDNLDVIDVN